MRLRDISFFISTLILAAALSAALDVMAAEPGPITPEEGKAMVQQQTDLVILDVRNPNEYVTVHYPDALNIPVNELETRLNEVPQGKPVLVHCGLGKRAQRGYEILKEKRPDIKELYYINGEVIF
ncbi:MAG: rhodanese-like domain-containing protein [Desulfovibrionaceae bacterium]|nr:rhodanese-like domain-containing protein [Desulfovibrionaceae bacterium]